jgi:hypothetical protein
MIHIFCALPFEAQPLIQHFKLTELKQFDLFRLYQSKDKNVTLTITGIGKINAASAVSYQHACINTKPSDVWLNIGVAGHASIDIGEARLVNKITDEMDNATWYPQIIFKSPCESTSSMTLNKPSTEYQDSLFDMEASAFYQLAIRLGTSELIHCFKVISDNTASPTSTVNADKVKTLIANHIKTIDNIIFELVPLSLELENINAEPKHYLDMLKKWRFTQTEKLQLSKLLQQWFVRYPNENIIDSLSEHTSGKSVLSALRNKINESEFMIHD